MTTTSTMLDHPHWLADGDPARYLAAPALGFTAYGVTLSTLGEEGDWVALGHVEPLRMLAAMRMVGRVHIGLDSDDVFGDYRGSRLVDNIKHGRAVFTSGPFEHPVEADWWCYYGLDAQASERAVDVTLWLC